MFYRLQQSVQEWSRDKGLDKAPVDKQMLKLVEEVGELAADVAKGRDPKDSIGDITVVLIILCQQLGLNLDQCLQQAYEEIANRKGKTVDGIFIKEQDLNG